MPRIPQTTVSDADYTSLDLTAVRKRIKDALGNKNDFTLEKLKFWIQAPVLPPQPNKDKEKEICGTDADCERRAGNIAPLISTGLYKPADLHTKAVPGPASRRWDVIDTKLRAGNAVFIRGNDTHVGGDRSIFSRGGFHALLFVAVGTDAAGHPRYVGLDPDISATAESRALWLKLVPDPTKKTAHELLAAATAADLYKIVKTLYLGEKGDTKGVGPLIRKYEIADKNALFPAIGRGL